NLGAGISTLALNKKRSTVLDYKFIVATDCGGVFLCDSEQSSRSTLQNRSANFENEPDLLDPVVNTFEGHIGPVTKVEFCPFSNDIFMSCGCDGRLFIRDRDQFEPLRILEVSIGALNSVAWSNGRPSTILCGNSNGELIFINLFNENGYFSKIWHANSSLSSMNHPVGITDLSFNSSPGKADWLAVGDSSGALHILQIVDETESSPTDDFRLLDILRKRH
uniref:Uncharacterized protein n=1 Tax=Romanomermis culicivorax TaxID=13658 RepID=A0A915L2I7_ROMCU